MIEQSFNTLAIIIIGIVIIIGVLAFKIFQLEEKLERLTKEKAGTGDGPA